MVDRGIAIYDAFMSEPSKRAATLKVAEVNE